MKFLEILVESREDDFKITFSKKFNGEQLQMIVDLVKQLPSGTKFLTFLGKTLPKNFNSGILDGYVKQSLKKFISIGANLPKKDINQYDSIEELQNSIDAYENRIRRSVQTIEGADLVYEDDRFTVVAPLTTQASCYYGSGTKWCTASSADNSHFNKYMEDGKLFYILDKTKPTSDRFYKVALLLKFDGNEIYYDAPDNQFNSGWIFGKKELKNIKENVKNYMNSKYGEQIELYKDKEKVRLERERIARQRLIREKEEHLNEAQERRDSNEWDLQTIEPGSIGAMAHALFKKLVDSNDIESLKEEDKQRKLELESKLEILQQQYNELENSNENTDLVSEIESTEEELEEIKNKKDVYDIIPLSTDYSGLKLFTTSDFEDTWKIGDYNTTEQAAKENIESLIDDIGYESFNTSFVESHVDSDAYESYLKEFFNEDVYDNPESYLDEDKRELSSNQENLISELNKKIQILFQKHSSIKNELDNMDEDSDEYSELEELLDGIENEVHETEDEITEIRENPEGDYDEDELENVVDNMVSQYENDIDDFVNTYIGSDLTDFLKNNNLIDKSDFIDSVIESDGWGATLNSYDGTMDEEIVNGQPYFIFYEERFNGF